MKAFRILRPSSTWDMASRTAVMGPSLLLIRGKASDDWTREAGKVLRGHDDGGAPAAGVEGDTGQLEQPRVDVGRQPQQVAKRGDGTDLQTRERLEVIRRHHAQVFDADGALERAGIDAAVRLHDE